MLPFVLSGIDAAAISSLMLVRELIASGRLGRMLHVRVTVPGFTHPLGGELLTDLGQAVPVASILSFLFIDGAEPLSVVGCPAESFESSAAGRPQNFGLIQPAEGPPSVKFLTAEVLPRTRADPHQLQLEISGDCGVILWGSRTAGDGAFLDLTRPVQEQRFCPLQ